LLTRAVPVRLLTRAAPVRLLTRAVPLAAAHRYTSPVTVSRVLHLWFGFRDPVSRLAYFASGVALMAVKYGVDALLVYKTRHVHPPHLDGSIRSKRGEFRLVALPGGKTRLEGSTWYELSMSPEPYWATLSDLLIHAIHHRVLAHVKHLSEEARP
jgi:hypothetical protein